MRGQQGKNETNLHEGWMEEGDLLPGIETGDKPREVQRPARWRSLPRCCSCPLHCPTHNPAHTAQAPADLYLLPRSRSHRAKFHQLSTSAERGLFCMCTILSTGWSSCRLPLFRGPLAHSCSPFLVGVFLGPAISTNSTMTVLNVSALTPFHREKSGARGPVGMSVRGEPTGPAYKSRLGAGGNAMPSIRASAHTGLGSNWPCTKTVP